MNSIPKWSAILMKACKRKKEKRDRNVRNRVKYKYNLDKAVLQNGVGSGPTKAQPCPSKAVLGWEFRELSSHKKGHVFGEGHE